MISIGSAVQNILVFDKLGLKAKKRSCNSRGHFLCDVCAKPLNISLSFKYMNKWK